VATAKDRGGSKVNPDSTHLRSAMGEPHAVYPPPGQVYLPPPPQSPQQATYMPTVPPHPQSPPQPMYASPVQPMYTPTGPPQPHPPPQPVYSPPAHAPEYKLTQPTVPQGPTGAPNATVGSGSVHYGLHSQRVTCSNCHQVVQTNIESNPCTVVNWLVTLFTCLFCIFLVPNTSKVTHTCSNCSAHLGDNGMV
jgi:hypothetical protein